MASNRKIGFLDYLTTTRQAVGGNNWMDAWDDVTLVVGSEACDLDSAVCSLTYAYSLYKQEAVNSRRLIVPLLNIPARDFTLKTEVVFALQEQQIERAHLVFLDDITLQATDAQRVKLVLVDHACPVGKLANLGADVIEIVDHHVSSYNQNRSYPPNVRVTVEAAGSCATLIGEKLLSCPETGALSATSAYLLYETIILDTVNFSADARKATPKDRYIADQLLTMVSNSKRPEEILSRLLDAKSDVDLLTICQLLQKDMKIVRANADGKELRLAVCSQPVLVKDRCSTESSQTEIESFCHDQGFIGVVVLGVAVREEQVQRDVLVYSADNSCLHKTVNALHERRRTSTLLLQTAEEAFHPKNSCFRYFLQNNTNASRKQLLPVLQAVLDTLHVVLPPFHPGQDDDEENESSLDVYPTVVPPNSYVGESLLQDSHSVLGHVSQRVRKMENAPQHHNEVRAEEKSPVKAGTFDYDNWNRNEPFTPSNTFVEESVLAKQGAYLPAHQVGALHNKMAYLKQKQESDDHDREGRVDKDSDTGIFEMEDEDIKPMLRFL